MASVPQPPARQPSAPSPSPSVPEPPAGKIIPLMPGVSRNTAQRRPMLREAVLQVVEHLIVCAVPPSRRLPLFDQAADLLDEAGWGLDELAEATEEGPARQALLAALGLLDLPEEIT